VAPFEVSGEQGRSYAYCMRRLLLGLYVFGAIFFASLFLAGLIEDLFGHRGEGWTAWISDAFILIGLIACVQAFRLTLARPPAVERDVAWRSPDPTWPPLHAG
jgi:hypothetical protein